MLYNLLLIACDGVRCLLIFLSFALPICIFIYLRPFVYEWGVPRCFLNLLILALLEALIIAAALGCEKIRKWYFRKTCENKELGDFDAEAAMSLDRFYKKIDTPPFWLIAILAFMSVALLVVGLPLFIIYQVLG